ncbi:MAG: GTPase [Halobacteriales archaeon]
MPASTATAIVAKRVDRPPVDTAEIRHLTEAAGYTVVDVVTQVRREDPGSFLGRGKLATLGDRAHEHDVDLVVVDGSVAPGQYRTIADALPPDADLFDRHRLVLQIFAEGATDEGARKQVELATLRYELERFEAVTDESPLTRLAEKGSRRYDLRDRIAALERDLAAMPDPADRLRERQRRHGLDVVSLAGYTNAGKSTLLHRLADDLDLDRLDATPDDIDPAAAVEDRPFETLETTTRRATMRGRPTLCVDTVGYLDDLPHWLIRSFGETLSAAGAADVVVLVVDAGADPATMRRRYGVARAVLEEQDVSPGAIVVACNKVDRLDADELAERLAIVERDDVGEVVPVSAREGTNLDDLIDAVVERLPTDERHLEMAQGDAAMRLVSRAYDELVVADVTYGTDRVRLAVRGRPSAVERFVADATERGARVSPSTEPEADPVS